MMTPCMTYCTPVEAWAMLVKLVSSVTNKRAGDRAAMLPTPPVKRGAADDNRDDRGQQELVADAEAGIADIGGDQQAAEHGEGGAEHVGEHQHGARRHAHQMRSALVGADRIEPAAIGRPAHRIRQATATTSQQSALAGRPTTEPWPRRRTRALQMPCGAPPV